MSLGQNNIGMRDFKIYPLPGDPQTADCGPHVVC